MSTPATKPPWIVLIVVLTALGALVAWHLSIQSRQRAAAIAPAPVTVPTPTTTPAAGTVTYAGTFVYAGEPKVTSYPNALRTLTT